MDINVYIFTLVKFLRKNKRMRTKKTDRDPDLEVSGHGLRSGVPVNTQVRSGLRSGVRKTAGHSCELDFFIILSFRTEWSSEWKEILGDS
jgi:hypothetical protein